MKTAEWIDFGQVSAERDEYLSQYFFDNGVIERVVGNKHQFLVLGRKGAGKTAAFQHLKDSEGRYLPSGAIALHLSLQNYSWDIHALLSSEGKAEALSYIESWKYVIFLSALKRLFESERRLTKKARSCQKLISRIYSSPAPTLGEVVGQKLLQLSRLKLPSGALDLESGDLDQVSIEGGEVSFANTKDRTDLQTALNQSIERLTQIFEEALKEAIADGAQIFVSFDRIDEAWDEASLNVSRRIIAGLIGACETITNSFNGGIRPIVFLREDIFESLDINDRNKLRADCGQLLAWGKDGLTRVVLDRVNYFAARSGQPTLDRIEDLYDREQMRQQRAPFDYIFLRSMNRPRDVIRLQQLIKSDMLDRLNNPYDEEEICSNALECMSIYNAEPAYSEWLVEELRDEWRVQYPLIESILSALQNMGQTTFTPEEMQESLAKIGNEVERIELTKILRFMFDNSIIGFRLGTNQQWRFKCFFKSQGFVESEVYKIHDGLHRGLNLTESRMSKQADTKQQ